MAIAFSSQPAYHSLTSGALMFFILSKTLGPLLFPLPLFMLAALAFLIFRKRPRLRIMFALVLFVFYALSTPACSNLLVRSYELRQPESALPKAHYDVAVVLTGIVNLDVSRDDYIEFGSGANRILVAMALVRKGRVDKLLISGGNGDLFQRHLRESDLLRRFAIDSGVPAERILVEHDSRNTYENAHNSAQMLKRVAPGGNILLITSAFHMRRSLLCFRKQGLTPDVLTVDYLGKETFDILDLLPTSAALNTTTVCIRELIGLLGYRLKGYI
jgi:uncharacterized SAM-binding protein YcdF (DUF218 family)